MIVKSRLLLVLRPEAVCVVGAAVTTVAAAAAPLPPPPPLLLPHLPAPVCDRDLLVTCCCGSALPAFSL